MRKGDYNENKEWRKNVGLIKTSVVLKSAIAQGIINSIPINKNKCCIEIPHKIHLSHKIRFG